MRALERTVQEELTLAGMGPSGWAKLMVQMAQGFRPALAADEDQAETDRPAKYKPKLFTLPDGTKALKVDERTQFKALQLIAEVHGWRSSGVNVNVNTAPGGNAGNGSARTIGDVVVLLEGSGNQDLIDAVKLLPAEDRRRVTLAMLDKCRDEIQNANAIEAKGETSNESP